MATNGSLLRQKLTYGRQARDVTPSGSNVSLTDDEQFVCVTAEGNLVVRPKRNSQGNNITFTGCAVGFIPPFEVSAVINTGTTCSVCTFKY